jgi:hypothetical protein
MITLLRSTVVFTFYNIIIVTDRAMKYRGHKFPVGNNNNNIIIIILCCPARLDKN